MTSRRGTIALGSFAVISVLLLYAGIDSTVVREDTEHPAIMRNTYVIELKESLTMSDTINAEILHPLVGTIQYSIDGTACWIIEDKSGAFYYRLLEECPENA